MIKNMDIKMWMLEWEDDDGKTPIMMSLERGHEEATLAVCLAATSHSPTKVSVGSVAAAWCRRQLYE